MSIQQIFLGAGGDVIRVDTATISRDNTGGASASFKLDADGQAYYADDSSGGALTARYSWVIPNANAALYDVRWTPGSGTVDSTPGADSTNLSLGTDRTWTETNGAGVESASFTVTVHNAGDSGNPLATAVITLEVDGS